ncbi:MAG: hypothetical protein NZO16_01400 [Deltaproteobacteria bacterium]|nr:hypothetical protein [Deltaproteobacteria bacterium]
MFFPLIGPKEGECRVIALPCEGILILNVFDQNCRLINVLKLSGATVFDFCLSEIMPDLGNKTTLIRANVGFLKAEGQGVVRVIMEFMNQSVILEPFESVTANLEYYFSSFDCLLLVLNESERCGKTKITLRGTVMNLPCHPGITVLPVVSEFEECMSVSFSSMVRISRIRYFNDQKSNFYNS